MERITIDLRTARTKKAVHEIIKEQMHFPEYYGGNLDALYDCLTDIATDTCVAVKMCPYDMEMSEYAVLLQTVFADAQAANENLAVFFD